MQTTILKTVQEILNFSVGKLTVGNVLSAIVIFFICHMFIKAIMGPIEKLLNKLSADPTLQGFLRAVVRVLLNFVAVCVVAESVGIPIASLLAVLGMLGLAISLSVQGALSNLANGILLIITSPFKVGHYVALNGGEGVVKEINMLCTKILTIDNKEVIIPNSQVTGGTITNFSSEPLRRVDIEVKAGYNNDTQVVLKALNKAVEVTPKALQDPAPFVKIIGYNEYSISYIMRVWCKSEDYWDVYFALTENIGKEKDAAGVKGGVPGMNVFMQDK